MIEFTADILIDKQFKLGEGPVWNNFTDTLNFVDIENRKIYEYNPENGDLQYITVDNRVGCIVPAEDGDIIAGVTDKLVLIDRKTNNKNIIKEFCLPETVRFNDGKCDRNGRLLIGTMAVDQSSKSAENCGCLYCYEAGKSEKILLNNMTIPNGLAFSKDNRILYHIDTKTQTVMAYPYNIHDGSINKGFPVLTFPVEYGSPDGMCIDENDNLWIALWGGNKVVCVDTKIKEIVSVINVDAKYVSCCSFGGKALDELFITTAMDEESKGGQVFHIKLNVKGTLPYKFSRGEQYGN